MNHLSMSAPESKQIRGKLFAAAWRGQGEDLRSILQERSDLLDARDENGVTALRFTAQFGHADLTRFLLERGAAVDLAARDGMTPLMAAVEQGNLEIVQMLLSRGANPNARAKLMNPLLLSREKGHTDVEAALVEAGAKETLGLIGDASKRYREIKCCIS